jgi:two-component sensor histidine kinase
MAESKLTPYAIAILFVAAVAAFRLSFGFVLAPGAYYYLYYPAVAVVAYLYGMRPAMTATLFAGAIAYFVFGQPPLQFKTDLRAHLNLLMFVISSATIAFVITSMRSRLEDLSRDLNEVRAVTKGQANVFREYAERVSNHLQLLSALLHLRAQDERESDYARVIRNAASRTLLISRTHRRFAQPDEARIDFGVFAERLADAALENHQGPALTVFVDGQLDLLPEQTTSLGLLVLECINLRRRRGGSGTMRIQVTRRGEEGVLSIQADGDRAQLREEDLKLFHALAEQVGGRLVIGANEERGLLRLTFPTNLQPLPQWDSPLTLN